MAQTNAKLIKGHFKDYQTLIEAQIALDYQVVGAVQLDPQNPDYFYQAMVKGVASTFEPSTVTISYAASATTDGIEVTFTVVDDDGVAVSGIHSLEVWVSDDADGSGLTATAASGALTPVTGTIKSALTAKKHALCNTNASGVLTLLLVDSANTAGEYFCCANPVSGEIVLGDATVAGDYEGG